MRRHGFIRGLKVALIQNKKARFDYTIEDKYEAGLVLQGWEVKSIRESRAYLTEAHIFVREGELFLLNAQVVPLGTASTHEKPQPTRTRKLLMHKKEIMRIIGLIERSGYTLVPLDMHFKGGKVKLTIGLAKGKRKFEKRAEESKRDWKREQQRLMKKKMRN